MPIAPSTYYDHINRQPSRRQVRDETLKAQIARVHAENYGVYGARKVWLVLNREGITVARCTVERLMAELAPDRRGSGQDQTHHDRRPDRSAACRSRAAAVRPPAPNRLWVADLTYVSTWSGFAYVAFVVDAYARRILGWRVATTMTTAQWCSTRSNTPSGPDSKKEPSITKMLSTIRIGDLSTHRSGSPSGSPRHASSPLSGRSAALMTTRSPKLSTGCTRPS